MQAGGRLEHLINEAVNNVKISALSHLMTVIVMPVGLLILTAGLGFIIHKIDTFQDSIGAMHFDIGQLQVKATDEHDIRLLMDQEHNRRLGLLEEQSNNGKGIP